MSEMGAHESPSRDLWLIRSASLVFSGPYSFEDLRTRVLRGEIGFKDEVCPAGGEWIRLSHQDEVKRYLGGAFQQLLDEAATRQRAEEATDTRTDPMGASARGLTSQKRGTAEIRSTSSVRTPPYDSTAPSASRDLPLESQRERSLKSPRIILDSRGVSRSDQSQGPGVHPSEWYGDGRVLRPLGVLFAVLVMGALYFLLLRVRIFG